MRPHYRPPIGMPLGKQRRALSFAISALLHLLVIGLLLLPFTSPSALRAALGAGGLGPAGGGGGGGGGNGSNNGPLVRKQERVDYVRIAEPQVTKPIPEAPKPPVVPPAVTPKPEVVTPPPPPQPQSAVSPPDAGAATVSTNSGGDAGVGTGAGGGTGSGTGPGSGGGSGSGAGTGKGSGIGSGTGGGMGTAYPPTPTELFLPPLPVPSKARGTIVVVFDVDSTGKVLDLFFEPTKDGKYNKKLREALAEIRFRPAVSAQGLPIRARTQITYSL